MSVITGRAFAKALEEAGVVSDINRIERIVIDVRANEPVRVYVQRFGDERLLDAIRGPLGMMLADVAPEPATCCDLHGRNCEYETPCCEECTEVRHLRWMDERGRWHYGHPRGEVCSNPNLSAGGDA